MKRKLLKVSIYLGLVALLFAPSAQAAPLVIATTPQFADGMWLYSYGLENPLDSGENVYDFGLDFFGEAFNITQPEFWEAPFYAPGTDTVPSFIDWPAAFDLQHDLLPGSTVTGFSFQSVLAPGEIVFHLATTERAIDGTTVGPSVNPVPEPGTLLLLGMGATGLLAKRRRSKLQA